MTDHRDSLDDAPQWGSHLVAFLLGAGIVAALAWLMSRDARGSSAGRRVADARLDVALEDTFPASDPPAITSTPRTI